MANRSKINDLRYWKKWRESGAVGSYIDTVLKPEDFESHTAQYVALAGEVAKTRRLKDIRRALREKGFETYKTGNGLLVAVVETSNGSPSVRNYWDSRGRVCRTEFIGDRGAIKTDGITNVYEFDASGRLILFNQLIREKGQEPRLFRGTSYHYLQGRPNSEYTTIYKEIDGGVETLTFKDRQENNARDSHHI